MKRVGLACLVALLAVGVATAAEIQLNPNPPSGTSGAAYAPRLPNITQSVDPSTVVTGSIACSGGGLSTDNSFTRRFFLNADHGIVNQYNVTSVDVGIESVTVYDVNDPPLAVNLYSIAHGAPFTFANLTLIGTATRTFPTGTALVIENFAATGSIADPVATDLVVEFFIPNGQTAPNMWGVWPGSNALGETQPTYIAAASCGIPEPATTASIGFPNMHLVMTVYGDELPVELQSFTAE